MSRFNRLFGFLLIGVVYYSLAALIYKIEFQPENWAPLFHPQRGFALAVACFLGLPALIPCFTAALLINLFYWKEPLGMALAIALNAMSAIAIVAWVAQKVLSRSSPYQDIRKWALFICVIIPTYFLSQTLIDFGFYSFFSPSELFDWRNRLFRWISADALGTIFLFPFFMELLHTFSNSKWKKIISRSLLHAVAGAMVVSFLLWFDFTKLGLKESTGDYLSVFVLVGLGFLLTPLGVTTAVFFLGLLIACDRIGLIDPKGSITLLSSWDPSFYLAIMGVLTPVISILAKKNSTQQLKENYELIKTALNVPGTPEPHSSLSKYSPPSQLEPGGEHLGIGLFDLEYRCLDLNEQLAHLYQLPKEECLGKNPVERLGDKGKSLFPILDEVVKTKKPVWNIQLSFRLPAQTLEQNLRISYLPVLSKTQKVTGIVGIVTSLPATPIDSRYSSEEDRSLSRRPLDAQSAVAFSHDIQEPLRNVFQSLQILKAKFKLTSDLDTLNFLDSSLISLERMKDMMKSFLDLQQLDFVELNQEEVEIRTLFEETLLLLKYQIAQSQAEITCTGLPSLKVDKIQMLRVLSNLLSNSIKYRSDKPLIISFSAKDLAHHYEFQLKDNGQGFDPKNSHLIFAPYQRLHSFHEIEGYGVGLSISKKIVELHAGQMWAHSVLGQGTSFFFTIPKD